MSQVQSPLGREKPKSKSFRPGAPIRSDGHEKHHSATTKITLLSGILGLWVAVWLAFGLGISSIPEAIIFSIVAAVSLAAVTTAFPGKATFSYKKLFKATGILAVLMFGLVLFLSTFHLIEMPH